MISSKCLEIVIFPIPSNFSLPKVWKWTNSDLAWCASAFKVIPLSYSVPCLSSSGGSY